MTSKHLVADLEREPWSIDNRRIGDDYGFKTLEAAQAAAEAA